MADTRTEWRAERRGDHADGSGSWLDDRGVSEVIGSILVFGLLVSLLAIVQTQAVPDANNEVEVKHNADVQGDMANLQSAILRTGTFGGAESTTVETGMTYPPRLVLYNPPAVQGVLSTGDQQPLALGNISAANDETADYLDSTSTAFREWNTSSVSYRVDYNRYQGAPTVRYEHTAVVNDFGNDSTVETRGSLINGNRITLVLLRDGLEETGVRPASVTTYPVSAPAQPVDVEVSDDVTVGVIQLPTDVNESVWATELLADQYDTNAFDQTPAERGECGDFGSSAGPGPGANTVNADPDDGRFVVGCDYGTTAAGQSFINIYLENESTYDLAVSRVGFRASSEPLNATYLTDTASTPDEVTFELRDRYNNPVEKRLVVNATAPSDIGTSSPTNTTYNVGSNGRVTVPRTSEQQAVVLRSGPNAFNPANTSLSPSDCVGHPGCALVSSLSTTGSAATQVRVNSVTTTGQQQQTDSINFTFDNTGPEAAKISEVQLGYGTQRTEQSFTVTVGGITSCITDPTSCSTETVSASLVNDGPDTIEQIEVDGSSNPYEPPSGISGAEENGAPVNFTDTDDGLPELGAGSTTNVTFVLNEEVSVQDTDSVDLSVTVYYADGSVGTYSRTLFAGDGNNG